MVRGGIRSAASAAFDQRLLALKAEQPGLSIGKLARALGVSKGVVAGRLGRLGLGGPQALLDVQRPRKERVRARDRVPRLAATLEALASVVAGEAVVEAVAVPAVEEAAPAPSVVVPVPVVVSRGSCCWTDGVRGAWVICDRPAEGRRPFCAEHAALGFGGGTRSERAAA